ncbi:MAG: hypothetical protein HOQ32_18615 [Lysobacter sp.]|nr:hypothetical protein [Lysobacter sp.]
MNTGQRRRARGHAALEYLLGLGLLSGGLGLGAPLIEDAPERHTLSSTLHSFGADVAYARDAAAALRTQVVLCPRAADGRCRPNGRWESGWLVFVDRDGDRRPDDADAPLREVVFARPTLSLRSTHGRPLLRYGRGGDNPGRGQLLLACRGDALLGALRIDAAGRARTTLPKHPSRCPPP